MHPDFNQAFPLKLCINLSSRPDRWAKSLEQADYFHWTGFKRFRATSIFPDRARNCLASHKRAMRWFLRSPHNRLLILEDDFLVLYHPFQEVWSVISPHVPEDWDLLYLGGLYGDCPISRVSLYVLQAHLIHGTHAYAINRYYAAYVLSCLSQPIDNAFGELSHGAKHYILSPRLIAQSPGYSDIEYRDANYLHYHLDTRHEFSV